MQVGVLLCRQLGTVAALLCGAVRLQKAAPACFQRLCGMLSSCLHYQN